MATFEVDPRTVQDLWATSGQHCQRIHEAKVRVGRHLARKEGRVLAATYLVGTGYNFCTYLRYLSADRAMSKSASVKPTGLQ